MDAIQEFYAGLAASQESLGAEFESILYANLWELYETDDDPIVYWGA
jgi:hypothetical protein